MLLEATVREYERLRKAGRRVLIFANSDHEEQAILDAIPAAHKVQPKGRRAGQDAPHKAADGPLVVTIHRGAHGLNLQSQADAIICRPQPGDLVEQMKGRVDRPGQTRDDLVSLPFLRLCQFCFSLRFAFEF